jgi:hypothetical protein
MWWILLQVFVVLLLGVATAGLSFRYGAKYSSRLWADNIHRPDFVVHDGKRYKVVIPTEDMDPKRTMHKIGNGAFVTRVLLLSEEALSEHGVGVVRGGQNICRFAWDVFQYDKVNTQVAADCPVALFYDREGKTYVYKNKYGKTGLVMLEAAKEVKTDPMGIEEKERIAEEDRGKRPDKRDKRKAARVG